MNFRDLKKILLYFTLQQLNFFKILLKTVLLFNSDFKVEYQSFRGNADAWYTEPDILTRVVGRQPEHRWFGKSQRSRGEEPRSGSKVKMVVP